MTDIFLFKIQVLSCPAMPKLLWLSKYRPELKPENPALQARLDEGNAVGYLAMALFGDYTDFSKIKDMPPEEQTAARAQSA